jgi:hypothetical protein
MQCVVYQDPPGVSAKLAEMGLSYEILREAIDYGQLHWSSCTRNDPPSVPGILAWGKTMRRLRELLIPHGWSALNESGLPLVVNPTGSIAIAVTAGDEGTGDPSRAARTKYAKGPVTVSFIEQNGLQLSLFENEETARVIKRRERDSDCMTWVLLLHRSNGEICCELSLPSSIDFDGRGSECVERIFLEPAPFDPEGNDFMLEDSGEDFNIEISRRG